MRLQKFQDMENTLSREQLLQLKGGTGGEVPSLAVCTGCDLTGADVWDCQDGDYVID